MYVGAVCHDLDHRGFNNKFMIDVGSPLAAIYSTSTMEHHHFNMSVNILQQENHNIFAKLNPDEYRQEWSYKLYNCFPSSHPAWISPRWPEPIKGNILVFCSADS